jgi:ATP-dependent protease ClpP protease subunit
MRRKGRPRMPSRVTTTVTKSQLSNVMRQFDEGDRVAVIGTPHEAGHGVGVVDCVNGNAYGIIFDGMKAMGVHKWYCDDELQLIAEEPGETDGEGVEPVETPVPGGAERGMAMNRAQVFQPPTARIQQGPPSWYRIENNLSGGTATIHIYDEIGGWGITAQSFVGELNSLGAAAIDLHINSPGGEIFDGLAIYNSLRSSAATVTIYVDSIAASIASVIAMAGDRVIMQPHSQLMIHDGSGLCVGNASDMLEMAQLLDRQSDNIAGVYAERASGTVAEWRARMQTETWYSAEEAVAAGLADEVASAKKQPAGAPAPAMAWDLSMYRYQGRTQAPPPDVPQLLATASPVHRTATVDTPWDAGAQEKRLPSPLSVTTAKKAYGWYDNAQVEDGKLPKGSCKLPHHEVSADGTPGAANLPGVRNALSRLPQSDIPASEQAAVKAHLQAHLDDAKEPADRVDPAPVAEAQLELTDWDPQVFQTAMARATGQLTDWDPAMFRDAVTASATSAPAPLRLAPTAEPIETGWAAPAEPAPEPDPIRRLFSTAVRAVADHAPAPTAPARSESTVEPGWAPPPAAPPEPERDTFAELFRVAMRDAVNHAPAPTIPAPGPEPEHEPFDTTALTRALREAVR